MGEAIGQKGFNPAATARGRRILQRLGLGKSWRLGGAAQGGLGGWGDVGRCGWWAVKVG